MVVHGQQPYAQGGKDLLLTDNDADRQLSLRIASSIPLPPEVSMMEERDSRRYHSWMQFYQIMGVDDHPVIRILSENRRTMAMAVAVSKAPYLERASHLKAWNSGEGVKVINLAGGG